ncbi:XRE family transcriptional regulator [Streptomyces sp. B21-101]|uniref:XRE family transcriptional regulator n=1 Tax=Streptomyces sp. B21-101 TaxID=3039415 RepID=UPI002FF34D25
MYDRTVLLTAARSRGDMRPAHLANRLQVPRNTAWRLWHGRTAPSAALAARVEATYGITAAQLITPAAREAAA